MYWWIPNDDFSLIKEKAVSIVILNFEDFLRDELDTKKFFSQDVIFPYWENEAKFVFEDNESVKELYIYCIKWNKHWILIQCLFLCYIKLAYLASFTIKFFLPSTFPPINKDVILSALIASSMFTFVSFLVAWSKAAVFNWS